MLARRYAAAALLLSVLSLGARPAQALVDVPALSGRVIDLASLLPSERARALEATLGAYERETRHQVVVLTIPSLEGEAIEGYSLRVVEAWKIGQAEFDNGVLILVSESDRRARIEVGYGLEGVIPDAVAARILRDHMIPEFRRGAMGDGIEAGVTAIMKAGRGEALPEAPARRPRGGSGGQSLNGFFLAVLVGAFLGSAIGRRRRWLAALSGGGIAFAIGLLVTFSILAATVGSVLGGLLGLVFTLNGGFATHRIGRGYGGSWGSGGFGGGGFGGGFGGGGGSFGGGGASGGW